MPNRSDWTPGATVTFVVAGTLTGDMVSIGCQHVNVADLVKVASALTKGPAGITATVTGTITPDDLVTFEGSTRSFTVSQVREVARNVQITAPSEPELTEADLYPGLILTDTPEGYTGADYGYWMVGAPLARDPEGYPLPIFRVKGANLSDRTSWDRLPYWQNIARGQRRRLRKATGAFDTKDPRGDEKPDPATLSWQAGDLVERNGIRRERLANGRWRNLRSGTVSDWTDADYNRAISGDGYGTWTVIRKGGVDLV